MSMTLIFPAHRHVVTPLDQARDHVPISIALTTPELERLHADTACGDPSVKGKYSAGRSCSRAPATQCHHRWSRSAREIRRSGRRSRFARTRSAPRRSGQSARIYLIQVRLRTRAPPVDLDWVRWAPACMNARFVMIWQMRSGSGWSGCYPRPRRDEARRSVAGVPNGDQRGDLPCPGWVCGAESAGVLWGLADGPRLASLGEGRAFARRSAGIRAATRSS